MAIWTAKDMPRQDGRHVVVTGGVSGIGFQTARAMAAAGASVLIAGRHSAKGEKALDELRRLVPGGDFSFAALDLADLRSVENFSSTLLDAGRPIDVLFNVAGVMMIPKRTLTADGFEMHMGTNMLGHFALTGRLMPALAEANGRVVTVSARAAQWYALDLNDLQSEISYKPMRAYGLSKLADTLFAVELNRHAQATGVTSLAVDPGTANTELQRHTPNLFRHMAARLIDFVGYPLDRVADTLVFAATTAATGPETYIGPTTMIQSRGSPGSIRLPKQALDDAFRRALWQRAETLTHVRYPFNRGPLP